MTPILLATAVVGVGFAIDVIRGRPYTKKMSKALGMKTKGKRHGNRARCANCQRAR